MENLQKTLRSLPHESGVYTFFNAKGQIIYVGKAKDLSRRVKQYFHADSARGPKTTSLVAEISRIETIKTTSEFDALLLEAKLIRQYLPKFNAALRDDKSYIYVCLTCSESLPRVLLLRKGDTIQFAKKKRNAIYGPFQSSVAIRTLLRYLRTVIPYCSQKERTGKPCFYTHLGLCAPCPSVIAREPVEQKKKNAKIYRANIYKLKALFEGKSIAVRAALEKEMHTYASTQEFERAIVSKRRIDALYRISQMQYDPAIFLDRGAEHIYGEELAAFLHALQPHYASLSVLDRIECFDISHLGGTATAGSMVVFYHGKPDTSSYRRFRIKTVKGISDTASMQEVLTRRFTHTEWPVPNLVIVDGGKGQVAAALAVLARTSERNVPVIGLSKRNEELIIPNGDKFFVLRLPLSGNGIKVAQRIRDEAHRFALTYNRMLRKKQLLPV